MASLALALAALSLFACCTRGAAGGGSATGVDVSLRTSLDPALSVVADGVTDYHFDMSTGLGDRYNALPTRSMTFDWWASANESTAGPRLQYRLVMLQGVTYRSKEINFLGPDELAVDLALTGDVPSAQSPQNFSVSLTCSGFYDVNVALVLSVASPAENYTAYDVAIAWRWWCVPPTCSGDCELHGECANEGTANISCACEGAWSGTDCTVMMTQAGTDYPGGGFAVCPGEPLEAVWQLEGSRTDNTYWDLWSNSEDTAWGIFLPSDSMAGNATIWVVVPPGQYTIWIYEDLQTNSPLSAIPVVMKDWSECLPAGTNLTCASDSDCGGDEGRGACSNETRRCECVAGVGWWHDCSHGCGGRLELADAAGTLGTDEPLRGQQRKRGYPNYANCEWDIAPPAGDWDLIVVTLEECDLGLGDTFTFFEWDGKTKGAAVLTLSEKSVPGVSVELEATRLLAAFESDYITAGGGVVVSYATARSPRGINKSAIAGGASAAGVVVVAVVVVMLVLYRRSTLKIRSLENELNRVLVSDILGTPAEKAVKSLQGIKARRWLRDRDRKELNSIIQMIGTNKLYKVELRKKLNNVDLGSDVNGFLYDQLGDVESARSPRLPEKSGLPRISKSMSMSITDTLDRWDFDIRKISECESPLTSVGLHLIEKYGLIDSLELDQGKLIHFLRTIESGYKDTPYHSSAHAADVAQALCCIIDASPFTFSDLDLLSAIIAATGHDYAHPGVNSQYLASTLHPLALQSNFMSILESMHAAETTRIIMEEKNNFISHLSRDSQLDFLKSIVQLIMVTDLSRHVEFMGLVSVKQSAGQLGDKTKAERLVLLQLFLKVADLSNPARPWPLCEYWASQVMQEFFQQGDKEKEVGLPVSAFMDRAKCDVPKCQVTFMEFLVAPMAEMLAKVVPKTSDFVLANLRSNIDTWKAVQKGNGSNA
eukprot:m51a1_g8801 putative 3 5 -cyclic nucleotide phosphodiesterase (939) ;mRNA; f:256111-259462